MGRNLYGMPADGRRMTESAVGFPWAGGFPLASKEQNAKVALRLKVRGAYSQSDTLLRLHFTNRVADITIIASASVGIAGQDEE